MINKIPTESDIRSYRNVPVSVAARFLGIGEETLKKGLVDEDFPFGRFIQTGAERGTYQISSSALINYFEYGYGVTIVGDRSDT